MGLEAATYIDGLVTTNPVGATDSRRTADDHIRLLKSTIKATFPNINGAVNATPAELNVLDGADTSGFMASFLAQNTGALTRAKIGAASLASPNNFTNLQQYSSGSSINLLTALTMTANALSFKITGTSAPILEVESTDPGAGTSPLIDLDRASPSPAVDDGLGVVAWKGRNASAGEVYYSSVETYMRSITAAAESGEMQLRTIQAGVWSDRFNVGAGVWTAGATGGDQGVDTFNTSKLYLDGFLSVGYDILATLTASSSGSIDITDMTGYDDYIVVFENVIPATDGTSFRSRTSTNNGVSFDGGTLNYDWAFSGRDSNGSIVTGDNAGGVGTTYIELASNIENTTAFGGLCGHIVIPNPADATYYQLAKFHCMYGTSVGAYTAHVDGAARRKASTAIDAIQFFMSAGLIATGTFRLLGRKYT